MAQNYSRILAMLRKVSVYAASSELLQLLEELASRAWNVNAAGDAAFAVFHALDDAGGLPTLGAIRTLGGIHDLFAVGCFRDLGAYCHDESLLISNVRAAFRRFL
jgi:hypothetical protein